MKALDARALAEIDAACWYRVADIAKLLGVQPRTVRAWIDRQPNVFKTAPKPGSSIGRLVSGESLQAFFGGLVMQSASLSASRPESEIQASARANKALADIRIPKKG
jgi:hypothetical protein